MVNWKNNLITIWVSQFLCIMGFTFAIPFVPFYMQTLGVTDQARLKLWVAVFAAAAPMAMAVFAPIWGALADRFGRRGMLLRATLGLTVVMALMSQATSVRQLILLRLLQGALSGTTTAAQTLVTAHTPDSRTGFALGMLSSALYSGLLAGNFVGGWFAELYGYRAAFGVGACILSAATLIVLFAVKEDFTRKARGNPRRRIKAALGRFAVTWSILALISAMAFARQFDVPMLPLFIQQEIIGTLKGASGWTGTLNAACGGAGLLAGLILGWLADRISPARIGKASAVIAGLFMVVHGLATSLVLVFPVRFVIVFCAGGLDPVFQIWLTRITPQKSRGAVFGWALTAKCVAWTVAPMASGVVAAVFGLRAVFVVGAFCYLALVPFINYVVRRLALRPQSCGIDGRRETVAQRVEFEQDQAPRAGGDPDLDRSAS